MDTVVVIFHEDNLLGGPLYICEMPTPPRVGEEVALSVKGLAGTVLRVGWEIAAEGIFVQVTLNEQEPDPGSQALALWREWFAAFGNPFISSDWDGDEPGYTCFFCGAFEAGAQRPEHKQDCVYVRAKRLVTPSVPE